MQEAFLYDVIGDGVVKCNLCERRCRIPPGASGFCKVRRNVDGKLYTMAYGKVVAENPDPVEKKPLYHFYPGSRTFSIATVGCNFRCQFCCNFEISQADEVWGEELEPDQVVDRAKKNDCMIISYTYTEPTIFMEYALDIAKLARQEGLRNTFVTNGYMTPEAIELIAPSLDAVTLDIKASCDPRFYARYMGVPNTQPIYNSLRIFKAKGVHVEVTDLMVSGRGESMDDLRDLVAWIVENIGVDVPFHVLSFFPSYTMSDVPPTPIKTIEEGLRVATSAGLKYVYGGNVPGHKSESTYCPKCAELLLKRIGFTVVQCKLTEGKRCPNCGEKIPIVGNITSTSL